MYSAVDHQTYVQEWHDDYLTWDPDKYDGVKQIVLSPTEIWLPDIGIKNRSAVQQLHWGTYSFLWRGQVQLTKHWGLWRFGLAAARWSLYAGAG